jgi:hypothetical protein
MKVQHIISRKSIAITDQMFEEDDAYGSDDDEATSASAAHLHRKTKDWRDTMNPCSAYFKM